MSGLVVGGTVGIDTIRAPWGSADRVLGGSASYAATAAAILSDGVELVGAVGDDFPKAHTAAMKAIGIGLEGLEVRSGEQTFQWGGCYGDNPDQRTTDFTILGVLEGAPAPVPSGLSQCTKLLLGNSHPVHQAALLDEMPSVDLAVADTMGLWIDVARPELESLLTRVHGVVMNEEEAASFTGAPSLVDAALRLLDLGPNFSVVKKGQHGCIIASAEGLAVLPAWPSLSSEVCDPTGAGDTFVGAMMASLPSQSAPSLLDLRNASALGTVTASFTIADFATKALHKAGEAGIRDRLCAFREMCAFS